MPLSSTDGHYNEPDGRWTSAIALGQRKMGYCEGTWSLLAQTQIVSVKN